MIMNTAVFSGCAGVTGLSGGREKYIRAHRTVKPGMLRPGDTVGLVAPASGVDHQGYEKAIAHLNAWGLKVKEGRHLLDKTGYLAGRDEDRVADLHEMYRDDEVKAIWCIRGGYGVTRILPLLDYRLIAAHPKPVIGYSDITALIHAIHLKTGIVGFHGPIGKGPNDPYSHAMLQQVLFENNPQSTISYQSMEGGEGEVYTPEVIAPGDAEGVLSGGNLTLLAALSGTPFHWDAKGKLVFIEDVGEKPYRIDRMLTTLLQSARLPEAKGIILGVFRGCEAKEGSDSLTLKQVLKDRLGNLGIPVFYGFTFGHTDKMCTFPVGIRARWSMEDRQIQILEPAVIG